tara:strand:- start:1226 stop:3181 length:1956 start_codon:yes stop_codon:yes gene_type:complete
MKKSQNIVDRLLKKVWSDIDIKLTEGIYTEEFLKSFYYHLIDEVGQTKADILIQEFDKDKESEEEERPEVGDEKEIDKYDMLTQIEKDELKKKKDENIILPKVVLSEGKREEATLNTMMYETAALIGTTGVSISPFIDLLNVPTIFKKLKVKTSDDIQEFESQCKSIIDLAKIAKKELDKGLGGSNDWDSSGVSRIKGLVVPELKKENGVPVFFENGLQDIAVCGGLAWGMSEFIQSKVPFSPTYFIHGKITDFYSTEINRNITRKGSKAATPDAIIANVPADKLLSSLADTSNHIEGDVSKGVVTLGSSIQYMQVSLKKSIGGAQIGKFTKLIRNTYDLGMSNKDAAIALSENTDLDIINNLIYEGIFDKLKNITSTIFLKAKSLVNNGLSKIKGFFTKSFSNGAKIPPKSVNKLISGYSLKEWTQTDSDMLFEGKMTDNTKNIVNTIYKNPKKAYSNLNDKLKTTQKTISGLGELGYSSITSLGSVSKIPKLKGDKVPGSTVVLTLISNMATLDTLDDLSAKSKSLKSIVANMVTEMLFGATNQPVWKVYGKMSSGDKAFSYLGTAKTVEERLSSEDINVQLIGVDIHPKSSAPYYVISSYLLQEISDTGKFYVKIRTGTNSSSRMSFVFEGQSILGPYDLDTELKDIL